MKLGVFTVSVPEWDPVQCIEKLAAIGYDGIEWRICEDAGDRAKPSFWSGNRTSMTATELIERSRDLKRKAKACGIAMPSLGSYINADRLDWVEEHMRACNAIGAKALRIGPGGYHPANGTYPKQIVKVREQYKKVAKLAAKYKVRALIETHMGQFCPTVHKAMGVLQELDPKHVGIMWDPGNQVTEGSERYDMAIEIAGPYLAEVHVKNAEWIPTPQKNGAVSWKSQSCPVHKGIIDWPAVIKSLKAHRYKGWLFFEDFSTAEPMAARVKRNLKWFRSLLAS